MALSDKQLNEIEAGDLLERRGGGTARVHSRIDATNGKSAFEIDKKNTDETTVKHGYRIKKEFYGTVYEKG